VPGRLDRVWERSRQAIERDDVCLHDLGHTGLTWVGASGASLAEIMWRGGQSSAAAAMRYQHSTMERDRLIADALSDLAAKPNLIQANPSQFVRARVAHESPHGVASHLCLRFR
jgi:hypothetical protein